MELGLSTSVLGVRALPDRLKILAAHGVSWVEVHGYTPEDFDFGDRALVEATADASTGTDCASGPATAPPETPTTSPPPIPTSEPDRLP
jgi:hypothetical protein